MESSHDTEMLECTSKESVVSNPALQHHTDDVMEVGSLSKQELGDRIGVATAAAIESVGVEAPPAITQPDEEMEVVAPPIITLPDKDMEDAIPSENEVPADGLEDGEPQATLEHAGDLLEDVSADGLEEVAQPLEIIPPAMTDPSLGKEVAPVAASPPGSQERPFMHADAETGMEDQIGKVIDDNPGEATSIRAIKFDVAASGDQDSEALLVESRVNLSRIPNSPESTH